MDEIERKCRVCELLLPAAAFPWHRKERGQRLRICRACASEYGRKHYAAGRQRYIDRSRIRTRLLQRERTRYLIEYFASHPCVDCGESDPVVLEFDHLDPATKAFTIGQELANRSWRKVLEEIAKCDVVCGNCHRRRTHRRGGTVRLRLGGLM